MFIVIDTQVYKINDTEALEVRARQNAWLESILESNALPKTVFTHTPLWLETADEIFPGVEGESVPYDQRQYLIDLFAENNVDSVFAGHVHFQNLQLAPYRGIKQYVVTSINAQDQWYNEETGNTWGYSEPAYYRINVSNGTITDVVTITKTRSDPMLEEMKNSSFKTEFFFSFFILFAFMFMCFITF